MEGAGDSTSAGGGGGAEGTGMVQVPIIEDMDWYIMQEGGA